MMPAYNSLLKVRQADHKFNASLDFIDPVENAKINVKGKQV